MRCLMFAKLVALFVVCFFFARGLSAGETAQSKSVKVVESNRLPFSFRRTVEITRETSPVEQVAGPRCVTGRCSKVTRIVERSSERRFRLFRRWR